jgi:hypothetical protein
MKVMCELQVKQAFSAFGLEKRLSIFNLWTIRVFEKVKQIKTLIK